MIGLVSDKNGTPKKFSVVQSGPLRIRYLLSISCGPSLSISIESNPDLLFWPAPVAMLRSCQVLSSFARKPFSIVHIVHAKSIWCTRALVKTLNRPRPFWRWIRQLYFSKRVNTQTIGLCRQAVLKLEQGKILNLGLPDSYQNDHLVPGQSCFKL